MYSVISLQAVFYVALTQIDLQGPFPHKNRVIITINHTIAHEYNKFILSFELSPLDASISPLVQTIRENL